MVLSEGAEWDGYSVREYGEADAFGHRKKVKCRRGLGEEIQKRTKAETVISDLTYDLRSGEADFIDKMIASTFGHMAVECIEQTIGFMTAIANGSTLLCRFPILNLGPRHIDVESLYDTDRSCPKYSESPACPFFSPECNSNLPPQPRIQGSKD